MLATDKQINEMIHRKLMRIMRARGKQYPKRHGEWYTLSILDKVLKLDTWNNQILVCGKAEVGGRDYYGKVTTWRTLGRYSIAIDFGGAEYNQIMLRFWYAHANMPLDGPVPTAVQKVKAIREATGCGLYMAKNCLYEANLDVEQAIELVRVR